MEEKDIQMLSYLLEENGYEVTDDNITNLIEMIENDTVFILDSSNLNICEGMDADYLYMQLLENNGYEVSEDNINLLKVAETNNRLMLY